MIRKEHNHEEGFYFVLISIHGLIRGEDLELGRDADTGGQTKYVVELAKALGERPEVARVDLVTRRIVDADISADYSKHREVLSENVSIIRIDCGEEGYILKEKLWTCLDSFSDSLLEFLNNQPLRPTIIHSHYADAGYVGTRISHQLEIPLIHTGHSLGRSKRRRLLAAGHSKEALEDQYHISRRIEAEEAVLGAADRVITSTRQEIEEQYERYDHYQPDRMRVVPPGTDLQLFHPPAGEDEYTQIVEELKRYLGDFSKPIILALSRPDPRKNIIELIAAYGESKELQQKANLVIIAGNRDDIQDLERGARDVLTEILLTIDQYDLYGKVAYPKHHQSTDVPLLYRLAAIKGGVFINPALTEPFGLTLIEAAASGLPIVATEDGGPIDIIRNCENGYLINPLDRDDIKTKLLKIIENKGRWKEFAKRGLKGVRKHYSWQAHTESYLNVIQPLIHEKESPQPYKPIRRRSLHRDRAIFSDLDQNLLSDPQALGSFIDVLKANRNTLLFGIATGRRLDSAIHALRKHRIPFPDVLITSLGTEIYYAPNLVHDSAWELHIDHRWNRRVILRTLKNIPGIKLQERNHRSQYKISYYIDPTIAPDLQEINSLLNQAGIAATTTISFGQFLDIIPMRASKGLALRWFADRRDISLDHILVAGGSGADEDMMRGNTLAVVVANRHHEELSDLENSQRIFFATQPHAKGIVEAIEHYSFLDSIKGH